MTSILEVSHLTKRFGTFTAVNDVSFQVGEGEIVGLLGPNGAGKTTTLSMLIDLIEPTSGTITMFGLDLKTHRTEILKKTNFCSAYTRAPWRLTVWEHLYVFARIYEVENPKRRVDEMLIEFHLTKQARVLIGDLSSGNVARLNLCKAFINEPRLVLMDEPTSSLDPDVADRVRKTIKRKTVDHNTAILFSSHNMAEVEELCDRLIFINKGRIITEGTPKQLTKGSTLVDYFLKEARNEN